MKVLILTVAGSSTRFSRSIGYECLKCIYYENTFEDTLLYRMIYKNRTFDKIIIVGGYMYSELKNAVETHFKDICYKIELVENTKFAEYGSGYSLYLGLLSAVNLNCDEIIFAEGDLWVDDISFNAVVNSNTNVLTFNNDTIDARKSVVLYFDSDEFVHYLYDTSHNFLEIKQPFSSIYNSGQIWKFVDIKRLKKSVDNLSEMDWQGTNLVFIQEYFGEMSKSDFELIEMKKWLNCNTVTDFLKIKEVQNDNT